MALTPTEKSMCNKLYGDYAAVIAPVKLGKSSILAQKSAFKNAISAISWSPLSKIMDSLSAVKDAVDIPLPLESSMNDIKNFLERCNYLGALSPASAALGAFKQALYGVDSSVQGQSLTTPEFTGALLANKLDSMLQGVGIPGGQNLTDALKKADEILQCLSSICAGTDPEYNGRVAQIASDTQSIYSDLGLIDNPGAANHGTMNYQTMYGELDFEEFQKANMEVSRLGIMETKLDIISQKDATMTKIQEFTKKGFF